MNILDLILIILIIGFAGYYYARGFAVAVLSFASYIIAFVLANMFSPFIARFLRETGGLFEWLKGWVAQTLNLNEFAAELAEQADAALSLENLLGMLSLPAFVQNQLILGNTEETRTLLNADTVTDFVSAFIAGAIINIIAIVSAFIIALILLRVVINMVDVVTRLPVIRQVNKLFGAGLGVFIGIFASWAVLTVTVWVLGNNPSHNIHELMEGSLIAAALQEINIISIIAAGT